MSQLLNNAHDFSITNLSVQNVSGDVNNYINNYNNRSSGKSALERLEENVSAGAAHNSDERCDAPKCHPETRIAVQDEIISWITAGDVDEKPKKILWLTGPAGSGKTAIARLRRHPSLSAFDQHILSTIDHDPTIFRTRLDDQLEELILEPLRQVHNQIGAPTVPKVIIIDGIDECEATKPFNRLMDEEEAKSIKEKDQLEILSLLLRAANDPCFPFRIVAVSRPERIISTFFSNAAESTLKLFLDDKYDPDSDIERFLQSKFAEMRRRYFLPPSWPTLDQIRTLVSNASGQFIYAATVIRFIEERSKLPQVQLDTVLSLGKHSNASNPFQALDALYTHILKSCPDPRSTIQCLHIYWNFFVAVPASLLRQYVDTTPGETEHLLGCLPSLIFLPPPGDDRSHPIKTYHKSLQDFVEAPERCGELYLHHDERQTLDKERFRRVLKGQIHYLTPWFYSPTDIICYTEKGPHISVIESDRELFVSHFIWRLPDLARLLVNDNLLCDARWWIDRFLDANEKEDGPNNQLICGLLATYILHSVHFMVGHLCNPEFSFLIPPPPSTPQCPRYRCLPTCKLWGTAVIEACKSRPHFTVPGALQLLYLRLAKFRTLTARRPSQIKPPFFIKWRLAHCYIPGERYEQWLALQLAEGRAENQ
ncbi:hypothetical protein DFP72DRAFT_1066784 [Ephemerocybe angulata]|uniref:NACHT domain-containing protein n=1 Tax=Ephemerocybe angulata TaxID=980116 RepID=A0A8H6I030_9AGAR|nr:hypothetical protein DFP72DRAFT_1066784 [Tulosesus angulatus]